jgi:hypothetical protein
MSGFNDDKHTDERRAVTRSGDNPRSDEDIRRQARHRLQTEGVEVGVRVLIELAEDKKQKGSTRGAAAKSLVQSGSTPATLSQEDLADLPAEQIRALLAEAQRALEARLNCLKTIEHEPTPPVEPRGSLFD